MHKVDIGSKGLSRFHNNQSIPHISSPDFLNHNNPPTTSNPVSLYLNTQASNNLVSLNHRPNSCNQAFHNLNSRTSSSQAFLNLRCRTSSNRDSHSLSLNSANKQDISRIYRKDICGIRIRSSHRCRCYRYRDLYNFCSSNYRSLNSR